MPVDDNDRVGVAEGLVHPWRVASVVVAEHLVELQQVVAHAAGLRAQYRMSVQGAFGLPVDAGAEEPGQHVRRHRILVEIGAESQNDVLHG